MPIFPFLGRRRRRQRAPQPAPTQAPTQVAPQAATHIARRHFYNESGFQTYATFFPLWDGWATAGHCLTEASDLIPPFATGPFSSWPDGLDAALIGGHLPARAPAPPRTGQRVIAHGYPAGSRHMETRNGAVYLMRSPGQWIVQLDDPDEPVVTGMSGGPILDADTGQPIGILITRNSPADLDADSDPDESYDFIALSDVWQALRSARVV